jgi:hypothetical protein
MLIYHRRQRWLFFVLIFGSFLLIYKYNHIKTYVLSDEHRIYTSLLIELPRLERLIRVKQTNLSYVQNRLIKIEKYLTKYTWHLNRLIKTIDYNEQQQQKRILHFNSFDLDLDKTRNDNHTKFLVYFHLINISNDIDYHSLYEFHSKIQSPYVTLNESEAYLHVIYLPIRSNKLTNCYKDLIDKKYFVLYEFINHIDGDIDEKCFHGNFLPVKFFTKFNIDQRDFYNDRWRFNDEQRPSIGIIYLDTNCKFNCL